MSSTGNLVIRNAELRESIFGQCCAVQAASQNLVVYSAIASQIVTLAWFVFPFIVNIRPERLVL